MSKQIEALKIAMGFASVISETYATGGEAEKVIQACKEALAEAEKQEPAKQKVKILYEKNGIQTCEILPTATWQSLSDGEIGKVLDDLDIGAAHTDWMINFAYVIEDKLKEKNHG